MTVKTITKDLVQQVLESFLPMLERLAVATPSMWDDRIVAVGRTILQSDLLMAWLYDRFQIQENAKIGATADQKFMQPEYLAVQDEFRARGIDWSWVQSFMQIAWPILQQLLSKTFNGQNVKMASTMGGVAGEHSEPDSIPPQQPAGELGTHVDAVKQAAEDVIQEVAAQVPQGEQSEAGCPCPDGDCETGAPQTEETQPIQGTQLPA